MVRSLRKCGNNAQNGGLAATCRWICSLCWTGGGGRAGPSGAVWEAGQDKRTGWAAKGTTGVERGRAVDPGLGGLCRRVVTCPQAEMGG